MTTLLLLDAHSLLHATHSLPVAQKLTPHSGPYSHQPIGTSYLFTRSLLSFLKQFSPAHIIAVFDGGRAPWRAQLLPSYKEPSNGPTTYEGHVFELNRQLLLKRVLPSLHIPALVFPATEADDLIAYLALRASRTTSFEQVTIVSSDADYDQLLRPLRLVRYDHRTKRLIAQRTSTLLKALTGCSTDNVPSIGRVGPATARKLLSNPLRLRSSLTPTQLQNLRRNYRLISLRYAARHLAPAIRSVLDEILREVRHTPPLVPRTLPPAARTLFRELEWTSLLS